MVLLGVGAFNFMPHGGPAPVAKPTTTATSTKAQTTAPAATMVQNPKYSDKLPTRDPFAEPAAIKEAALLKSSPQRMISPRSIGANAPSGTLPVPDGMNGSPLSGHLQLAPIAPQAPPFAYTLSGVIEGKTPAAVFSDSAGNQRLVPLGGSLDGDTTLEHVSASAVTVRYHGESIRLSLGDSQPGTK